MKVVSRLYLVEIVTMTEVLMALDTSLSFGVTWQTTITSLGTVTWLIITAIFQQTVTVKPSVSQSAAFGINKQAFINLCKRKNELIENFHRFLGKKLENDLLTEILNG
jgi:hypothetical protein